MIATNTNMENHLSMMPWVSPDRSAFAQLGDIQVSAPAQVAIAQGVDAAIVKWLVSLKDFRPFPECRGITGEAGWEILMDLYVSERMGKKTSVTSACIGSRVPPTTALRHLNALCDAGRIERHRDENDARRYWLRLPPDVAGEIERYLKVTVGELLALVELPR
jgi:hypothetical protein